MRNSRDTILSFLQRLREQQKEQKKPTIKKFLNYIEQYILITSDIQTHLTVVDVLFGIKQHNYGKVKTKRINHVILIAKMCISMYKKTNAFLPLSMIFENQLKLRNV